MLQSIEMEGSFYYIYPSYESNPFYFDDRTWNDDFFAKNWKQKLEMKSTLNDSAIGLRTNRDCEK